jgi:hypothetical protein
MQCSDGGGCCLWERFVKMMVLSLWPEIVASSIGLSLW